MHAEGDSPRGRLTALTRERDAALEELAAERARVEALMQQLERLALEVHQLRAGQTPVWTPALLDDRERQLAYARATIRNMERSWFWRARLVWVRLRALVGR